MTDLFLNKFWGKWCSIPVALALVVIGALGFIPDEDGSFIKLIIYGVASTLLFFVYCIYVVRNNALPSCKKNCKGVLFIFKVVSEKQYKDIQFLVKQNFANNINNISGKIYPVCLDYSELIKHKKYKDYDINNSKIMKDLLQKTNCYFCVEFFIETDSVDAPNNYQATINTGLLHPAVSEMLLTYLKEALFNGSMPVQKLRFTSGDKVDALKLTTIHLSVLSEYVAALLYLILNKPKDAVEVLKELYCICDRSQKMFEYICEAYYNASILASAQCLREFYETNSIDCLDKAENYLECANTAMPDQYDYHLNMASIVFLKRRDVVSAQNHIKRCKEINKNDHWKYSDIFLYTYADGNPNVVYQKYTNLSNNSYNCVEIISYIERVLEQEPDKYILHLALGVLYKNVGDLHLSSCHFIRFLNTNADSCQLRANTVKRIQLKLDYNICDENKDKNMCEKCLIHN